MEQVLPFLEGIFLIATSDHDQPHVRPFDGAGILYKLKIIQKLKFTPKMTRWVP